MTNCITFTCCIKISILNHNMFSCDAIGDWESNYRFVVKWIINLNSNLSIFAVNNVSVFTISIAQINCEDLNSAFGNITIRTIWCDTKWICFIASTLNWARIYNSLNNVVIYNTCCFNYKLITIFKLNFFSVNSSRSKQIRT